MKQQDNRIDGTCDLPACVDEYIARVTRKMHCRKRVRADVQAELRVHFEDALKDAATEEERQEQAEALIEAFGDAKLLAALCRRAKKRCRPLWIRALVRSLEVAGVFVLLFTVYTIWFVRGKASPTTDYVAELNRLTCPPGTEVSTNAWPCYETALSLAVEPSEAIKERVSLEQLRMPGSNGVGILTAEEKRAIQAWVAENSLAWEWLKIGSRKEHYHRVYRRSPETPLVMVARTILR